MNLGTLLIAAALTTPDAYAVQCGQDGGVCPLASSRSPNFTEGQVNGAAVWKNDGKAVVWITSSTNEATLYKVSICSAKKVEAVNHADDGEWQDAQVASPKGKKSGCDTYELRTGNQYDGFLVTPTGNTFKFFIEMNGQAKGFQVFNGDDTLPGRAGFYHFKL